MPLPKATKYDSAQAIREHEAKITICQIKKTVSDRGGLFV